MLQHSWSNPRDDRVHVKASAGLETNGPAGVFKVQSSGIWYKGEASPGSKRDAVHQRGRTAAGCTESSESLEPSLGHLPDKGTDKS